jgi:hypothetical protein
MPSFYGLPKYLLIDLSGYGEWLEDFSCYCNFTITEDTLIPFFIQNFKLLSTAAINLDYALIEMADKNYFISISDNLVNILTKLREAGLVLLDRLIKNGCYTNDKLMYQHCSLITQDTLMLWRPDKTDVELK